MSAVKSVDHGYDAMLKRIYGFGHPEVAMGILEADGAKEHEVEGYEEPVSIIDVAGWMEFGTEDIPARSFIRAWFDEASPKLRADFVKLLQAVVKGTRTKEEILELVGLRGQAGIQARIAAGIDPPLAASTIAAKGSSKPLIHTGQLRSSVSFAVRESGEGGQ